MFEIKLLNAQWIPLSSFFNSTKLDNFKQHKNVSSKCKNSMKGIFSSINKMQLKITLFYGFWYLQITGSRCIIHTFHPLHLMFLSILSFSFSVTRHSRVYFQTSNVLSFLYSNVIANFSNCKKQNFFQISWPCFHQL